MAAKVGQVVIDWVTNLAKFDADMNKASRSFNKTGRDMMQVGKTLTASLTLPIVGAGAAAIKLAGEFEQTTIAFNTLLGSSSKATTFLKDLEAFAARTPFEFEDLTNAAKRMMALGFEAEQVIQIMTSVGDAVAGLGGGAEMIDRVTLALGQMQAKGKVSAQEMNQLAEAGIPAWELLAERIGKSIPEAMKLAEKGAISASVAIPAILEGMNDKFAGMMDKQSKTLLGQWSNLKDQVYFTIRDLGMTLIPIAQQIMDDFVKPLLSGIKELAEWFADLPGPIQKTIIALAGIAAAAGPILIILGQMSLGFGGLIGLLPKLGTAVVALKGAFIGMSAALGPIGLALTAVAAGIVIFHDEIEDAIISVGRFVGLIDELPGVVGKNEQAYSRVANELKISNATLEKFTQTNSNALKILGQHRTEIDALQKKLASGKITQAEYEAELQKYIVTTPKAVTGTKNMAAAFVEGAGATNKAAEALKNLKEETTKALSPMDELAQKVETLISEGFDQHQVIKLFSDQIINASKKQLELTGKLSDGERALWAEAEAMEITKDRAEGMAQGFRIATDDSEDLSRALSDLKIKEEKVNREIRLSTDLWGDLHDELDRGEPGLDGLKDIYLPEISDGMNRMGKETKETSEEMTDFGRTVSTTLTNMTQNIADRVIKWKGFFGDFARGALSSFTEGLFAPLIKKFTDWGNLLSNWLNGLLSKLGNMLSNWVGGFLSDLLGGVNSFAGNLVGNILGTGGGGGGLNLGSLTKGGGLLNTIFGGGASSAALYGSSVLSASAGTGMIGGTAVADFVGPVAASASGAGGAGAGAGAGAAGGGGFMSSMSAFFTNPWTIGIAAAAGLGYLGYKFAKGPNSWEAGSKEAMRDFKVSISDDQIKQVVEALGLQENKIWDMRKDLLSSPQMLVNILGPMAEAQGKMSEFLKKLEAVETKWQTYNFRPAFEEGMKTGDWSKLNEIYVDAFEHSKTLASVMPDWQSKLLMVESATQESTDALLGSVTVMDENTIAITGNTDAIRKLIEYLTLAGYPGLTIGGDQASVPALASGIDSVPKDMLAFLHKGEMVIPAKIAKMFYGGMLYDNSAFKEIVAKLGELPEVVQDLVHPDMTTRYGGMLYPDISRERINEILASYPKMAQGPSTPSNENNFSIRSGDISLHFSINGGTNPDELVQIIKHKIIPVLNREMRGGNTELREAIRAAYDHTARAY